MANSSFISILKRMVKNEIVNDPLLVKTFGSPNYDVNDLDFSAEDVENNFIFTWGQTPGTITDDITFLTIQVDTYKYNDTWVIPQLIFTIYSHNKHMSLSPKEFPGITANRNDYLSQLLDEKFNGRSCLGIADSKDCVNLISKLELCQNLDRIFNDRFVYRYMVFKTKDVNDSMCDRR